MKPILILALAATLATSVFAQEGFGGPPPGGGPGFGGPGGRGGMRGGPQGFLLRPDVAQRLQLTEAQIEALRQLRPARPPQPPIDGQRPTPPNPAEVDAKIKGILSAQQYRAYLSLLANKVGVRSLLNPSMATTLGLSRDQMQKIAEMLRPEGGPGMGGPGIGGPGGPPPGEGGEGRGGQGRGGQGGRGGPGGPRPRPVDPAIVRQIEAVLTANQLSTFRGLAR